VLEREVKTSTMHLNIPPELVKKVDDLAKSKYRGVKRSQAIRWIIEDAWIEFQKEGKEEELRLDI
jgi:metal-responsive CopG/Arc/MetJ family transcriptional regulator